MWQNRTVSGMSEGAQFGKQYRRLLVLARSIRDALPAAELYALWDSMKANLSTDKWLYLGRILGQLAIIEEGRLTALFVEHGRSLVKELALANRFDFIESHSDVFGAAIEIALNGNGFQLQDMTNRQNESPYISHFGFALERDSYQAVFRPETPRFGQAFASGMSFRESLGYRRRSFSRAFADSSSIKGKVDDELLARCERFLETFARVSGLKSKEWTTSLAPWSELVSSGVKEFG